MQPLPDGERAAFEALTSSFRPSLQRYFARRVYNEVEIDDLVQQVFERLLKRGDIVGLENVRGYVFQTASSVFLDHMRHRRTRRVQAHELFDENRHEDVDFSPEHVLLDRERLAGAVAVLLELPERTRVIFVLRRLEGMKYRDIAARLGISVSAVEKHMERAVVRLMESREQE
jgi:RNA polymerase sigma-70 factor (ECF subfamily)